jgi:voltage-gated potassium channel
MTRSLSRLGGARLSKLHQRELRPAAILTVVLFLRVIMAPLGNDALPTLQVMASSLVVFGLVYMSSNTRKQLRLTVPLGLLSLFLDWGVFFGLSGQPILVLKAAVHIVLILFVFWIMLHELMVTSQVDATILLLAVNCYLLLGMVWAVFYSIAELASPGSFHMAATQDTETIFRQLHYFSFITLTTLGYGDITPASSAARSLVMGEAIIGVLYTTILIARLVGLYTGRFQQDQDRRDR